MNSTGLNPAHDQVKRARPRPRWQSYAETLGDLKNR
jgi:hypothetical protein